jgi:hypothetical protein
MVKLPLNADVLLATCNIFRLVFFMPSQIRRPNHSLRLVNVVLGAMRDHLDVYRLQVECILTLDVLLDSRQVLNFLGQHDAFRITTRTLFGIIGIKSVLVAKLEMGVLFPHALQSKFVQASLFLLGKLPVCVTSTDFSATTVSLANVVAQVMRQHKKDSTIQNAALHLLDKYMLPYSHLHHRFRQDTGLSLVRSAIELPDLTPASRVSAEKILRLCSVQVL